MAERPSGAGRGNGLSGTAGDCAGSIYSPEARPKEEPELLFSSVATQADRNLNRGLDRNRPIERRWRSQIAGLQHMAPSGARRWTAAAAELQSEAQVARIVVQRSVANITLRHERGHERRAGY